MRSVKSRIQTILKRAGWYHRLRTSGLHDLYSRIARKHSLEARKKQIDFYRHLLPGLRTGDLIFDVGANEGLKTDVFLRLGARVIAIEPDETNQSILQERFVKFRLGQRPLVIIGKALSDKDAVETMWIDGPGSAVNTLSQKWATTLKEDKARLKFEHCGLDFARQKTVETTTLERLIVLYGTPTFIKIDVEGYEFKVLQGLRRPVPNLSFEVNLPEFKSEGQQCVQFLGRLDGSGRFNYAVDCEKGLVLERWLSADKFLSVLELSANDSIEVFWKGRADETA